MATKPLRIRNRYLLMQLATIARLGRSGVSAQLLIEAWKARGLSVNEAFFLHFDVLFDYGFLAVAGESTSACRGPALSLANLEPLEIQVSITTSGNDFLERYGNAR